MHQQLPEMTVTELDIALRGVFLLAELAKENKHVRESLEVSDIHALRERLNTELDARLELENMDLSDCAGGACKL